MDKDELNFMYSREMMLKKAFEEVEEEHAYEEVDKEINYQRIDHLLRPSAPLENMSILLDESYFPISSYLLDAFIEFYEKILYDSHIEVPLEDYSYLFNQSSIDYLIRSGYPLIVASQEDEQTRSFVIIKDQEIRIAGLSYDCDRYSIVRLIQPQELNEYIEQHDLKEMCIDNVFFCGEPTNHSLTWYDITIDRKQAKIDDIFNRNLKLFDFLYDHLKEIK